MFRYGHDTEVLVEPPVGLTLDLLRRPEEVLKLGVVWPQSDQEFIRVKRELLTKANKFVKIESIRGVSDVVASFYTIVETPAGTNLSFLC